VDPVRTVRASVARALASLDAQARVGVALSGGADSMALADAAIAVAGPQRVVLLHVDHQLRGAAASADDAGLVTAFARAAATPVRVIAVDVARDAASLEAAARRARYDALDRAADELDLAVVLTAHTARDQAETVLMRILRGTGPAGLTGIRPRRGRYLRPLLATSRATIEAYVAARALAIADDPSNDDLRFFRNRVRARILPAI
jgi:tRNA(Ile)-lysidine synthase